MKFSRLFYFASPTLPFLPTFSALPIRTSRTALTARAARRLAAAVFVCGALLPALVAPVALTARAATEKPLVCAGKAALGLPEWARNAVIYEVNVSQFSKSGKLSAVTDALPRLRELGVTVLWLMPVHPIGKLNRLGPVGSNYSVRDYRAINPDYGTAGDFRKLVESAHARGLRVIMDWVGNHSAWDNPLTKEHPDFYVRDAQGNFTQAHGWRDVIQFDFSNHDVWDYEYETMAYWLRDYGVDGFRCDFADGPPTECWDYITAKLRALRPDLFMLAEAEKPQHQLKAFNASYGFSMMRAINDIAKGRAPLSRIDDTLARARVLFPDGAALLYYTSNHDENAAGTEYERLGGGAAPFAVLTFVLDGIPLIYNGQEAGLDRRLKPFQHDPITWRADPKAAFYRTLCELRQTHPALRTGAPMRRLPTTANESLYAVMREAADGSGRRVLALLNLTARDIAGASVYDPALAGAWKNVFAGEKEKKKEKEKTLFAAAQTFDLKAWEYRVYVSEASGK